MPETLYILGSNRRIEEEIKRQEANGSKPPLQKIILDPGPIFTLSLHWTD